MMARPLPAAEPNVETQPFWDAAAKGKLLIKHCDACNQPHYYPRALCPFCLSAETRWVETAGTGTVYSLSTMRRGKDAPYTLAYVTLDEGPNVLTNLDGDADAFAIGQRVRVSFAPTAEGAPPVPMFVPG